MVERKRGRAGQVQRARRMKLHPLCAECAKRGIVKATKWIDHIQELAFGGSDDDENTQGLCDLCHAIKTAMANPSGGGASNHPEWLKPSAIPLFIVCGPPCSGKSTYVDREAEAGDIVIDLDGIMARLSPSFRHWEGGLDPELFNRAVRVRNAMLGGLSSARAGRAFFIVSAPTLKERQWWWSKLGGQIVSLDPGDRVCRERARQRGTPGAVDGIRRWREASRLSWSPGRKRLPKGGVGEDGYPLEAGDGE